MRSYFVFDLLSVLPFEEIIAAALSGDGALEADSEVRAIYVLPDGVCS